MKAEFIEVCAGVRFWEDASVNGEADSDGALIPFRRDDKWCPVIRLEDGLVVNWPEGKTADVHYKVCDDGEYWLLDDENRRIAKWSGHYVPDKWLCPSSSGYGDYIIMSIGADGKVVGWVSPEIVKDQWVRLLPEVQSFEDWLETDPPLYDGLDAARAAWNAATAAELERCAALVDGIDGWRRDTNTYCDNLADAIRGGA